jgi:superfamily I DNA and/or RNA helicase
MTTPPTLDTGLFDVVIFDEASQILLEEAVPSLFRATQTIVVGDEMQLPPTNFFSARRPVSFHFMQHGVYEKRRNRAEAEYIAELVRALLTAEQHPTIGIVAFSEAQQDEIEAALQRLAAIDGDFQERLEAEFEREEDNQFAGLLVKNLENI